MKKLSLLIVFIFSFSTVFVSCKDTPKEESLEEELAVEDVEIDEQDDFDLFDENDDGWWDNDEFNEATDEDFTSWDTDADGSLNQEEFYGVTFGNADLDNDEMISEEEWNQGLENNYGEFAEETDFDLFDEDEDGFLEMEEWNLGFDDSEWFNDYDADDDSLIDDDEWNDGFFDDWDFNDDDKIDEEEYDAYSTFEEENM